MDLLAAGAGAAEGLDQHLQRLLEQAKLAQVAELTKTNQAETSRHNLAEEDLQSRYHQTQSMDAQARIREAAQAHDDAALRARRDDGRAVAEEIPGNSRLPEDDPGVAQMRDAGIGGLLKGLKSHPEIPVGPIMPGDTSAAVPVDSVIKGFTSKQIATSAGEAAKQREDAERNRHDLAMEQKQPREPNPQPQIFFDKDGKPHAIQFVGGASKEIPLDPNLTGKKDPNDPKSALMKQTGHAAVTRLDDDIDKADSMGLIGPASGRIYDQFAKFGTTGDTKKDQMIGRLKADIMMTKMHVDAGIGGTRAAASPLLLKNWDDIAMKSSKDLLHGYTSAIRDDMGPISGAAPATPSGAGGKNIIRYDLKGNIIPDPQ